MARFATPWFGIGLSLTMAAAAIMVLSGSDDVFRIYLGASLLAIGPVVSGQAAMRCIRIARVPLLTGAIIGAFVLTGVLALGIAVTGSVGKIATSIVFDGLTPEQDRDLTKHLWSIGAAFVSLSFGTIAVIAVGRWAARAVQGHTLVFCAAFAVIWACVYSIVSGIALGGIAPVIENAVYQIAGLPALVWQIVFVFVMGLIGHTSARVLPAG